MKPKGELTTALDRKLYERHHKHYLMVTDQRGGGYWINTKGEHQGQWHAISSKHMLDLAGCLVLQHTVDQRGQYVAYRMPSWLYDAQEDARVRAMLGNE